MVALRDFVSPTVLLIAFFTALLSSALDQYPSSLELEPIETQYALRTVAQQTRYEQHAHIARSSLFAPSSALFASAEVLFANASIAAPQSLAVSADNRAFVGLADGRIVSFRDDDSDATSPQLTLSTFARTGRELPDCGLNTATHETQVRCGRVVALAFASSKFFAPFVARIPAAELFPSEQVLIAADAFRGVFLLDARGRRTLLFNSAGKQNPLQHVTALAVSQRGEIVVTDTHHTNVVSSFLERSATGRIIRFRPQAKKPVARVAVSGLAFPTGAVFVDNDSAVLIALAAQHKIVKWTLTTDAVDDFAFTPGEPSGLALVALNGRHVLAAGLFLPDSYVDKYIFRSLQVRKLLSLLPHDVTLALLRLRAAFVTLDVENGDVLDVFEQKVGCVTSISSVFAYRNHLYVGRWDDSRRKDDGLVRVALPAASASVQVDNTKATNV